MKKQKNHISQMKEQEKSPGDFFSRRGERGGGNLKKIE